MRFQQAIVRTPGTDIANGLASTHSLGTPHYFRALSQHQAYIEVLQTAGLEITVLPAVDDLPDACFVEDPVVLTDKMAILTRPGAKTRQDEVAGIAPCIQHLFKQNVFSIQSPGTLEGGDVLRINNHFYIGLSERTNLDGARQFIRFVEQFSYTGSTIELSEVLHLKTGVAYLGNNHVLVSGEFINHPAFAEFKQIILPPAQAYAANSLAINDRVIMPLGFDEAVKLVKEQGFTVVGVDVSEFQKVDGGLSCLSLRF